MRQFLPFFEFFDDYWQGRRDEVDVSVLYARQKVGTHDYDVNQQNLQIAHLDFQQAFAPYAYRTADLDKYVVEMTWQHQLKSITVGVNGKLYLASGHRLDDANYTGNIGFPSTAPMISPDSDTHQERWGCAELTSTRKSKTIFCSSLVKKHFGCAEVTSTRKSKTIFCSSLVFS